MRSEETVERAIGQYADMVRRLCMLHLKNEADMEDIFQTVFLKYALDTTDFAGPDHEKAWLLRVTINACKDLRRSLFRRRTVPLDALEALPAAVTPDHREVLEAVLALPQIESCTASVDNTHCCLGEAGEVEAARELGLSYGKYRALLALQALDPTVTAGDVQALSTGQIWAMVEALEADDAGDAGDTGSSQGNGTGQQSGREQGCETQSGGQGSGAGHDGEHGHGRW